MQLSLLQINVMDPATLQFIIGLCGTFIFLLLSVIGFLINFILKNQKERNDQVFTALEKLSMSISKQSEATNELKNVVERITTGCELKHKIIDKFMENFDQ